LSGIRIILSKFNHQKRIDLKSKEESNCLNDNLTRKRMTKEQVFFLQVLSDYLSRCDTLPVYDLDWDIIYNISHIHQVEGIVYSQCKAFMPARFDFIRAHAAAAYFYKNRIRALSEVSSVFAQRRISFFTVKGIEVARFYPIPAMRTMGDTDIIVHRMDKEEAGKALIDIGFVYEFEFSEKEEGYLYQDMSFDLHHNLVYDEAVTLPEQKSFFNNCWEYVNNGELNHSFHFLFLLAHLRKHLMNEGAGFRMFMDVAVVGKNDEELDWIWIEEKLKELKLYRFAQTCSALIKCWFDIELPIDFTKLEESFEKQATETVFDNGIFGFHNGENANNRTFNEIRNIVGPRWLGRSVIIMKRAFPSYKYLCGGEQYSFLKGRPYMLPVAWLYRMYLMMKGKTTSGNTIMRKIMAPDKTLKSREDELRRWGLID